LHTHVVSCFYCILQRQDVWQQIKFKPLGDRALPHLPQAHQTACPRHRLLSNVQTFASAFPHSAATRSSRIFTLRSRRKPALLSSEQRQVPRSKLLHSSCAVQINRSKQRARVLESMGSVLGQMRGLPLLAGRCC
jgi:hypothetical protein